MKVDFSKIKYQRWDVIGWALTGAAFLFFELYGAFKDRDETMTRFTKRFVPKPIRAAGLGWIVYHFMGPYEPPSKKS